MMLQKMTPCFGIHIENQKFRLEASTSWNRYSDNFRFNEASARPQSPARFLHVRFGTTAIRTEGSTKSKTTSSFHGDKYLGGGWWQGHFVKTTSVFTDNLILEPGLDYYQYYANTKGDATIKGTNGQAIGSVVGSNMTVFSYYARLTLQREYEVGSVRYFIEYLHSMSIQFQDVNYGMIKTGLKPGGDAGFDVKKWGIRVGVELYANKLMSTRMVLGSAPGIKGRNAFSTYLAFGIPLVFDN